MIKTRKIIKHIINCIRNTSNEKSYIEDGWKHYIKVQYSLLKGKTVYEKHVSIDNQSLFYDEYYKVKLNGNKKRIFSSFGM